jgi:hypothetical protein
MIDPRLDVLVWGAVLLFLLLMGARAWAVETTAARNYRKSARVRALTGATALAFVALVGLVAMQGGVAFVQAVVTRTDPETFVTVVGDEDNTDQAVEDPDAQPDQPAAPADPNAPPAGAPGPADPNAPAADPNAPAAGQNAPARPGG